MNLFINRRLDLPLLFHYTPTEEITSYQSNNLNQYTMLSVDDLSDFIPDYDADGNQTRVKTSTGIWAISCDAENQPTDFIRVDSSGSTTLPS